MSCSIVRKSGVAEMLGSKLLGFFRLFVFSGIPAVNRNPQSGGNDDNGARGALWMEETEVDVVVLMVIMTEESPAFPLGDRLPLLVATECLFSFPPLLPVSIKW